MARAYELTDAIAERDGAFIDLLVAYRPHGGLSRINGLPVGVRYSCDGQDRLVEDLVDDGELFGFCWHDSFWLPLFQFELGQ